MKYFLKIAFLTLKKIMLQNQKSLSILFNKTVKLFYQDCSILTPWSKSHASNTFGELNKLIT